MTDTTEISFNARLIDEDVAITFRGGGGLYPIEVPHRYREYLVSARNIDWIKADQEDRLDDLAIEAVMECGDPLAFDRSTWEVGEWDFIHGTRMVNVTVWDDNA